MIYKVKYILKSQDFLCEAWSINNSEPNSFKNKPAPVADRFDNEILDTNFVDTEFGTSIPTTALFLYFIPRTPVLA